MWTRKAETLSKLKFIVNHPRANGKTWTMIHGIAKNEGGAVVIVANQDHARYIKSECRNPKIKFVSLDNLEKLNGNRLPVILDHFTVAHVLQYAFDMLRELQEENNLLKSENYELKQLKHGQPDPNSQDTKARKRIRNSTQER